ncbi:hypothetical protein T11_16726 [Trichinella zimbabwensis]|uniref:Uncharacterized protein n=1 Tax=Trichinella zimbabwensis TaxID=268475 RepID=A0A0V1HDZ9_9BILA|nr:hypothetical protein T11_16726 [Trichinella zimbabwensis]
MFMTLRQPLKTVVHCTIVGRLRLANIDQWLLPNKLSPTDDKLQPSAKLYPQMKSTGHDKHVSMGSGQGYGQSVVLNVSNPEPADSRGRMQAGRQAERFGFILSFKGSFRGAVQLRHLSWSYAKANQLFMTGDQLSPTP